MILRALGKCPIFMYSLLCAGALSAAQMSQVDMEFEQLKHELQTLESKLGSVGQEEMMFDDVDIKSLLEGVMEKLPNPSPALSKCYEKVCKGESLTINEVMDIMPELIDCAKQTTRSLLDEEDERAPRPDAAGVNAPNAIVGKNNCDLTQVLGLLAAIKKQIQNLQNIICRKFSETWTILAAIDITGIFTVLDALEEEICDKFFQTWTILDEIENEIIETQTIICDKFSQTWTILNEINNNVLETQTIICDKIEDLEVEICDKFFQTWTILDEINDNVLETQTIICDKIEDLEVEICDKFFQTWTILDEINDNVLETQTIICDKIENLTDQLACLLATGISEPTTITQPGVYCVLNDIVGTITIASPDVTLDINDFIIGGGGAGGGVTNAIVVTMNSDNVVIKNGRIVDFTSSGISASTLQNLIIEKVGFASGPIGIDVTQSNCIIVRGCIFRDLTSSAITISDSNTILLELIKAYNNIAPGGSPLNVINLASCNNAVINKYGCTLSTGDIFRGINAVSCLDLALKDVFIAQNNGSSLEALTLNQVSNAKLENCHTVNDSSITNPALSFGFGINQSSDITLKHCSARNITSPDGTPGNTAGFSINASSNIQHIDCSASNVVGNNNTAGFDVLSSQDILYDHCVSTSNVDTGLSGESFGFQAVSGIKIIYNECIANDNIASTTGNGFLLLNSDNSCVLRSIAKQNNGETGRGIAVLDSRECTVDLNLTTSNFGSSSSIGIHVANTGGGGTLNNTVINNKSAAHINNYLIDPGTIATILYIRDPFFVSSPPTGIDNFDIR